MPADLSTIFHDPVTTIDAPTPCVQIPEALQALLCVEEVRKATNSNSWAKAHELLADRTPTVSAHDTTITARMQGSAGDWYEQTLGLRTLKTKDKQVLTMACTCPASTPRTIGGEHRSCKHSIAVALHALGYVTAEKDPVQKQEPVTAPVGLLAEPAVRDLLAKAAENHPDVAAEIFAQAAASTSHTEYWQHAAVKAVSAVADGYDFNREWKWYGTAIAHSLRNVYSHAETARPADRIAGMLAVIAAAAAEATSNPGDRYGECGDLISEAVAQLCSDAESGHVTDTDRYTLGETFARITHSWGVLVDWECVADGTLATVLDTPGQQALSDAVADAERQLATVRAAATPAALAAQESRRKQIEHLEHAVQDARTMRDMLN